MFDKLTPFSYNVGTIYNALFDWQDYHIPPPLSTPRLAGLNRNLISWYSQLSLLISETLNKEYQMMISELKESVIVVSGSFLATLACAQTK